MASIERTAYPRFKRNPLAKELDALYTPTNDELSFARALARKAQSRFGLLLLLKSFQRLGYFPALVDIPLAIVQHVRNVSGIDDEISPIYPELAIGSHKPSVRSSSRHTPDADWRHNG